MSKKETAFVAYTSRDQNVAETIVESVRRVNAQPTPIHFESWEYNDVPGTPLVSPILEKIDDSPFIVADITYLNLNVVYEIGFAIGRNKRVFLIRHGSLDGDKGIATAVGIFDTLGYHEYADILDLTRRLSAHIEEAPLQTSYQLNQKSKAYLIEPPIRGPDVGVMVSRIKRAGYGRYRSFTPDEDTRLSAVDAIRQVSESYGIFIPLQHSEESSARVHNIRCLFIAGLADGMSKPKLILCPGQYDAPLDVRDDVKIWKDTTDIFRHVAEFCPKIVEYEGALQPTGIDRTSLLQSISIGDPRAENEMPTLESYYLHTDQFDRAYRGEVNLVVGRKGSGKTALFIRLRDMIRSDKRNIVVDLKPEGYQLIRIKEDILEYLSEGARQHLITAFWEYLIYLEIAYKLLDKDHRVHRFNHQIHDAYVELNNEYCSQEFKTEGDFSERLQNLCERLAERYQNQYGTEDERRLTSNEVTELVYTQHIRRLRDLISSYLHHKNSVWVLFDNLDKGWSTRGVDSIDAITLRCLVDAGRKVEREMRKADHSLHCIVFVRNDVYDHLMANSPDYGKEIRATLDWNDTDLLRELLRLRLVAGAEDKFDGFDFFTIWHELCASHYLGEETSAFLIDRTLMRPRNLLKAFNHCRGFATNFNHPRIEETDLEKGLRTYSSDLLEELDRELSDVFPVARDLLYHFMDSRPLLGNEDLHAVYNSANIGEEARGEITDFLLYYGVLGISDSTNEYFIYSVNYDLRMLKIRADRMGSKLRYALNRAFWPAFEISENPGAPPHSTTG